MKKCPTCQEEFSDQFKFCPVDSTLLSSGNNGASANPLALDAPAPEQVAAHADGGNGSAAASVTIPASVPAAGDGDGAYDDEATAAAGIAAGASNFVRPEREEFHLTFMNEERLTSRLL